ncbi:hypothetical protein Geob_0989 [Geotalea daltonii FRC-32]|uniref:Uncharacterized protein n=1 Tax=Geotalea daltonii (strain DSM 22248 / JCM 15807 / FRC-32) TaxID=316067 RepID=B9M2H2_GEODF|nr:hypothetical protein [Geotalea daltonii]ACM19351.1 hypothetical protein Geob_0989 [Geotalea daltonii FRC-32]
MATEIAMIKLCYQPSKFAGEELTEITATVSLSRPTDEAEISNTQITIHYLKRELQDKTLNEIYTYILNQAKQTLQIDVDEFPA